MRRSGIATACRQPCRRPLRGLCRGLCASFALAGCNDRPPEDPSPVVASAATASAQWGPWRDVGQLLDGDHVRWRTNPWPIPIGDPFSAEVELTPATEQRAQWLANATAIVDATMPHHGHGMNFRPPRSTLHPSASGALTTHVDGLLFHMQGKWLVSVDVVGADGVVDRASAVEDVQP